MARLAAEDAVSFWDEQGVFIKDTAEEVLVARVRSLAELADACFATEIIDDGELQRWIEHALDRGTGREQLLMACVLSAAVTDALARHAAETGWRPVLKELRRAVDIGAHLSSPAIRGLTDVILADRTASSWQRAYALASLPVPVDQQARVEALAAQSGETRCQFLRVASAVAWGRHTSESDADIRTFLTKDRTASPWESGWTPDDFPRLGYSRTFVAAAGFVLDDKDTDMVERLLTVVTTAHALWGLTGLRALLREQRLRKRRGRLRSP